MDGVDEGRAFAAVAGRVCRDLGSPTAVSPAGECSSSVVIQSQAKLRQGSDDGRNLRARIRLGIGTVAIVENSRVRVLAWAFGRGLRTDP